MTRPSSIPERLDKLDKRMQRIEDAITAKGIKFIDKREEYDWMPAAKAMDYVYDLVGVRYKWRNVYNWIHLGLIGRRGRKVHLKYDYLTPEHMWTRKLWIRTFLDQIRKGSI